MIQREGFSHHETAEVETGASIGEGTRIWNHAQIRKGSVLGRNCNVGKNVYIDTGVRVGDGVKIQNNVSLYDGVTVEDDVFIGPAAVFTNDLRPRAFLWDESRRETTLVRKGASIGANATIVCGGRIVGRYAMVAAGSVVTRDVPDHALVVGVPARVVGYVCKCGAKLRKEGAEWICTSETCPYDETYSLEDAS